MSELIYKELQLAFRSLGKEVKVLNRKMRKFVVAVNKRKPLIHKGGKPRG